MSSEEKLPRYAKRQRLSNACTECRRRKVRCDGGRPSCHNCVIRGKECIIVDVRNASNLADSSPGPSTQLRSSVPLQTTDNTSRSVFNAEYDQPRSMYLPASRHQASSPPSGRSVLSNPESENEASQTRQSPYITNRAQEDLQESLEASGGDMMNTEPMSYKRKLVAKGTLQSLARYVDRYFARKGIEPISPKFSFGMQHAEEVRMPRISDGLHLPALPPAADFDKLCSVYSQRVYPVFPVVGISELKSDYELLCQQDIAELAHGDVPRLVCLYSAIAITADEACGRYTSEGMAFLTAAYGLIAYVTSMPYLSSAQAMLMLSIGLRSRNKDGASRQTLGQAIRIAQSIGLHRKIDESANNGEQNIYQYNQKVEANVWWSCYCLEKAMGLEVGRPLAFRDDECDQVLPSKLGPRTEDGIDILEPMIGLAQIQSRLFEAIHHRSASRRNASSLLHDLGSIDQELCKWAASLPQEINPTSELLGSADNVGLATYLSISYFQTMITVHQVALLLDSEIYKANIEKHCRGALWKSRLLGSEKILLYSARKIAALQIDLIDNQTVSRHITMTPIMLSMFILALNVLKYPDCASNASDLGMLTPLSLYVEANYRAAGQSEEFISAITTLRSQMEAQVQRGYKIPSQNGPAQNELSHASGLPHVDNGLGETYSVSEGVHSALPADVEGLDEMPWNAWQASHIEQSWGWTLPDEAGFDLPDDFDWRSPRS